MKPLLTVVAGMDWLSQDEAKHRRRGSFQQQHLFTFGQVFPLESKKDNINLTWWKASAFKSSSFNLHIKEVTAGENVAS